MTYHEHGLLLGRPLEALDELNALLQAETEPNLLVLRIKALVWLGRIDAAARDAALLDREQAYQALGLALLAYAQGEPSRARLLLLGDAPEGLERGLAYRRTQAEVTRAAGDAATALQLAGGAAMRAEQADPIWQPWTQLTLGRCLAMAGDHTGAAHVLDQAIEGFESLTPGTVAVAEVLDARAQIARHLHDPGRAALLHREALELWNTLGEDSLPVATCTFQLAQAIHRTGDLDEALATMQLAFLRTQKALGHDHLDTWITRFELGRLELDNGDPFEGLPRMERAHAEIQRRLGPQHPVVRSIECYLPRRR